MSILVIAKLVALIVGIIYTPPVLKGTFKKGFYTPGSNIVLWGLGVGVFLIIQFHLY